MANPIISICIPLYEAGERLKACLDTILQQTFSDFEVIIVADAPKDGSIELAQSYALRDNRFHVYINEINQHIGKSRNLALSHAIGKYVTFVDHDDLLSNHLLAQLFTTAKSGNCDLVFSIPSTELQGDDVNNPIDPIWNNADYALVMSDLLTNGTIHQRNNSLFNTVWGCLYRRDFLVDHDIKFVDTRLTTPEDRIFQIECMLHNPNIDVIAEKLYLHTEHSANAGNQKWYNSIDRRIAGFRYIDNKMSELGVDKKLYSQFLQGAAFQFIRLLSAARVAGAECFTKTKEQLTSYPLCKLSMQYAPDSNAHSLVKKLYRKYLIWQLKRY